MTAESQSFADLGPQNSGWNAFGKYGLPGLVIAVLFYFVWDNMQASRSTIEKNSEAMISVNGSLVGVKEALKDNTAAMNGIKESLIRRQR